MPIFNTFSNRNRPPPAKLAYDSLPEELRHHSLRIIDRVLGHRDALLGRLDRVLQAEHPVPSFAEQRATEQESYEFQFLQAPGFYVYCVRDGDFDEAMDAIEMAASLINNETRKEVSGDQRADDALDEMNGRFAQHGVGYQFSKEQDHFVRMDSTLMHREVTQPAMLLLTEKGFEGAAHEFGQAHRFYREAAIDPARGKDAVAWAAKAVESTVKTIMTARGWVYDEKKDTIVPLLDKVFTNGLVPPDLKSYFEGLRTALYSGLPTLRNRMAGHGQGTTVKPIEAQSSPSACTSPPRPSGSSSRLTRRGLTSPFPRRRRHHGHEPGRSSSS
jgi:hypothetical protein